MIKQELPEAAKKRVLNRAVNVRWSTWEKLKEYCEPRKAPLGDIADLAINEFLERFEYEKIKQCARCNYEDIQEKDGKIWCRHCYAYTSLRTITRRKKRVDSAVESALSLKENTQ